MQKHLDKESNLHNESKLISSYSVSVSKIGEFDRSIKRSTSEKRSVKTALRSAQNGRIIFSCLILLKKDFEIHSVVVIILIYD